MNVSAFAFCNGKKLIASGVKHTYLDTAKNESCFNDKGNASPFAWRCCPPTKVELTTMSKLTQPASLRTCAGN